MSSLFARYHFLLFIIGLSFIFAPLDAIKANELITLRHHHDTDKARIVLELEEKPEFMAFLMDNPKRLVIDLNETTKTDLSPVALEQSIFRYLRFGKRHTNDLRLVLDLTNEFHYQYRYFLLQPDSNYQHYRLVVDVIPSSIPTILEDKDEQSYDIVDSEISDTSPPIPVTKNQPTDNRSDLLVIHPVRKPYKQEQPKPYVIVIDAGHGGRDPGAIGASGQQEKKITLMYAKALQEKIETNDRFIVKLTRDDDSYLRLRERVKLAQHFQGDMFISLHADAHPNKSVRGLSVYTLSEKASDKEAARLAERENSEHHLAEEVGLTSDESQITDILIDLIQRDTKNKSSIFADKLIKRLSSQVRILRNPHRFAGFRVLTSHNVPSVLVELGYLSNKKEANYLTQTRYRDKIVDTMYLAIEDYFNDI